MLINIPFFSVLDVCDICSRIFTGPNVTFFIVVKVYEQPQEEALFACFKPHFKADYSNKRITTQLADVFLTIINCCFCLLY